MQGPLELVSLRHFARHFVLKHFVNEELIWLCLLAW